MRLWPALVTLFALCVARPGLAAEATPPGPPCPPGNLLASARLSDSLDVVGVTGRVVDSIGVAEGGALSGATAVRFETLAGSLT